MGARGRGTLFAQSPDMLRELGYLAGERAAILEHDAGLDPAAATRAGWLEAEGLLAEQSGTARDNTLPQGQGVTSQWIPPSADSYGVDV